MYAIIESGGKQHRVEEGDVIDVELLKTELGENFNFENVLFVSDGEKSHIGSPNVAGFQVIGKIQEEIKGPKITCLKFKKRKNNRTKWGHRQKYNRVLIVGIKQAEGV
jgi:large subunit ribosomal protein L21